MMRRYVGRAKGKHRSTRQRRFKIFVFTGLSAAVLGLILIGVLIMNPGGHRPPNTEGSMSPSVTPAGTPSGSGHPRHCHHHHHCR